MYTPETRNEKQIWSLREKTLSVNERSKVKQEVREERKRTNGGLWKLIIVIIVAPPTGGGQEWQLGSFSNYTEAKIHQNCWFFSPSSYHNPITIT